MSSGLRIASYPFLIFIIKELDVKEIAAGTLKNYYRLLDV